MTIRILLASILATAPLAAQDTASVPLPPVEPARAGAAAGPSPLLPPEHWAVRAAERAYDLGMADGYLPAQRAAPRDAVHRALAGAAGADSARTAPAHRALAAGWLARFREEFPEYAPGARGGTVALLGARLTAGAAEAEGRLAPAVGYATAREDPRRIPDERGILAGAAGGVRLGRVAFAAGEAELAGGEVDAARWEAGIGAGGWALAGGRTEVVYGPGRGGSIVLSPGEAIPRVELRSTRPFRLPSVLRWLGPMSAQVFVSRTAGDERHPTEPWFWGMRLAARPHPRFTIAGNRAALFGGEGRPVTLEKVAGMLVGVIRSDFESQVISGDVRWRMPTERILPLTAYLEWGADDGAGGAHEMPGRVAGLFVPAVPGFPQLAVGAEVADVPSACCGHGPWYFNATFLGNWARGQALLAHPLGGEGREAAVYAQAELVDARLRMDARAFVRSRRQDSYERYGGGNLLGPARAGRSRGIDLRAAYRVAPGIDLAAAARREAGHGWSEHAVSAALAAYF